MVTRGKLVNSVKSLDKHDDKNSNPIEIKQLIMTKQKCQTKEQRRMKTN